MIEYLTEGRNEQLTFSQDGKVISSHTDVWFTVETWRFFYIRPKTKHKWIQNKFKSNRALLHLWIYRSINRMTVNLIWIESMHIDAVLSHKEWTFNILVKKCAFSATHLWKIENLHIKLFLSSTFNLVSYIYIGNRWKCICD